MEVVELLSLKLTQRYMAKKSSILTQIKQKFVNFDKFLDKHLFILLLLLLLTILRVPNFFDPYWYGDEAIYLTVGQSIRAGQKLYTDIVDHKTPLIYYFAAVPNQFWFRVLLYFWMIISTVLFVYITTKIIKNSTIKKIAAIVFVLLTTLPPFEGHIPNGELFVMGFVLAGLWLLAHSGYLEKLLQLSATSKQRKNVSSALKIKPYIVPLFGAGFLYGMGLLTKVPALLDFAGVLLIPWFYFSHQLVNKLPSYQLLILQSLSAVKKMVLSFYQSTLQLLRSKTLSSPTPSSISKKAKKIDKTQTFSENKYSFTLKELRSTVTKLLPHWLLLFVGLLTPLLISIGYFSAIGSGKDYLEFGLLYNLHYSQSWTHNFGSPIINFLFSLPGKTIALAVILITLTLIKKLSVKIKFVSGWFILTIYAVLLSNRPYPHYFLQSIPPLVLMTSGAIESLIIFYKKKKKSLVALYPVATSTFLVALSAIILITLNFGVYSTDKYYKNFYRFAKGEYDQEKYYQSFNHLIRDNYQLAHYFKKRQVKNLFIWGNNTMLYALSQTVPVGKFTVAFHITDLKVYDETMEAIKKEKPEYIVVMNNAPNNFPSFYKYLQLHYFNNSENRYQHMTVYYRNPD